MNFERHMDPKKALGLGLKIPDVQDLRKDKNRIREELWPLWQKYINIANQPGKSIPFRMYTRWWVETGHVRATPKDQVIFEMWVIEKCFQISIEEVLEAANDNWPNSREKFKKEIIQWFPKI